MRQSGTDIDDLAIPSWAYRAEDGDAAFDFSGMDLPGGDSSMLGKSFVDFAQWVFGPTGIRSLRLLAFGDFSYNGRFPVSTWLLCRRDLPVDAESSNRYLRFRTIKADGDTELWELYEREKYVLTACPTDSLFHPDWPEDESTTDESSTDESLAE